MMFRDSLARGRGMLFIHQTPGLYPYWMYQTRIPLDIVWMDRSHRIVEISPDTPPCKTKASLCARYGGHQTAQFVLELGDGEARRLGLSLGQAEGVRTSAGPWGGGMPHTVCGGGFQSDV